MREMDFRPILESSEFPPLVAHRGSAPRVWERRQPAERILGEEMGEEQDPALQARRENVQSVLSCLEQSLECHHPCARQAERILATVLITDIVESTSRAAALGDGAWRALLDRHDRISHSAVRDCDGRLVKRTGDGVLATFDSPARALHCAKALRVALSHAGIAIRGGVHTGEVELRGDDVAGIGVHIAARVVSLAGSGEVLVSRTVKDLVAGAGYSFSSRGVHSLKGIPEGWELLAVS